jgi:hypothetical protein
VEPQHGLDRRRVQPLGTAGEPVDDPGGLRLAFEADEVLLAAPAVHRHDGDEPATRDEPDEQQPPLELGHQAGRIGPGGGSSGGPFVPAYTRPR